MPGRIAASVTALAATALLFAAAPAMATVTSSQLSSVTTYDGVTSTSQDPLFSGFDGDAVTAPTTTVTGTVTTDDGNAADTVDVVCLYNDYGSTSDTVQNNVPVQPDGSFTATGGTFDQVTCHLVALPHNYSGPNDFGAFKPRTYGVGYSNYPASRTINTGGPNDGTHYSYYADQHQSKGYFEWRSVGDCGADWSNVFSGDNFQDFDEYTPFDCGLAQYTNGGGDGYGRSEVLIDGKSAYNSYGAAKQGGGTGGQDNANFPAVSYTRSTDPLTGDLTVNESENLVNCGSEAFAPGAACDPGNPNTYENTGVHFDRQIKQSNDGLKATVTDTYTSTDGADHAIDVEYDNYVDEDEVAGIKVPGSDRYKTYSDGDVVTLPAQATGTIYAKDLTYPAGDNPYYSLPGSYTYTTQPDRMFFNYGYNEDDSEFVLDYKRTVPAGSTVTITHVLNQGLTSEDVAKASDTQLPAVAITSPANGSSSASHDVVVTGTASDDSGTPSLAVNGIPTPVAADGTWSQHLNLPTGGDTITAVATDTAGNAAQAQTTVNVAIAQCTVPKVTGMTTAQATAALTGAGCKVGSQTKATSKTVKSGSVITQSIPAGLVGSLGLPVDIRISLGKFAGATLASKSIKLNGRSLVVTVKCGSSPVQTGTVKLRTTSGKKKTLGSAAFSCPKGKKRTVHFTISKTSAKALKKQKKTKATAYIVARNTTGDSIQKTGKLTIKG